MSFCTPDDLVALKKTDAFAPRLQGYRLGSISPAIINKSVAKTILKECLDAALERRQGNKANRPWFLVDVTKNLDPTQAWYGWEFEGGYATEEDYKRVIKYFWSRFPYSAIDIEGHGHYSAELTFSPCNEADLDDESFGLMKLTKFINRNKIGTTQWGIGSMVGTHVNISTPAYRALSQEQAYIVASRLGDMLNSGLTYDEKIEFFGRQPYGYAFPQRTSDGKQWIEFKVFNSTTDLDELRKYARTAKRIAFIMDQLAQTSISDDAQEAGLAACRHYWETHGHRNQYMAQTWSRSGNIAAVLRGESDEIVQPVMMYIPDAIYYYHGDGTPQRMAADAAAERAVREAIAAYVPVSQPVTTVTDHGTITVTF
jgi:hypothetical protein